MIKAPAVLTTSLAAVLTVSMIVTPAFASGHLVLDGLATDTKTSNDNARIKVSFTTGADVPTDGSGGGFGYAVLTGGLNNVLVLATHLGIDDSEHEDEMSGFHTHVLDLVEPSAACDGFSAEVDLASSIANKGFDLDADYSIDGSNVSIGYVPTKLLGGDTVSAVASFTVTPVFDGENLSNLCVTVMDLA